MSTLQDRVNEALSDSGMTKTSLWKCCGVSSGTVSGWVNGPTKVIDGDNLVKAARCLGVNPDWLAEGKGDKHPSLSSELVRAYGQKKTKTDQQSFEVPLMNASASMGEGVDQEAQEIVVDVLRVSRTWVNKNIHPISSINNLAFIHAIGDSMMPTFNDGDILLVDTGNKSVDANRTWKRNCSNEHAKRSNEPIRRWLR